MIPLNGITLKKLKFSREVIPQRDHSNGVCVGFPQSDSESDSFRMEIQVRLTERNKRKNLYQVALLSTFYNIPPKGKYYPFDGQYLPTNGFKFTFNGVIHIRSINRTWISTQMESDSESDWGNPTQTPFEWSLCGITSSENFNFFLCNSIKRNHMSHSKLNRKRQVTPLARRSSIKLLSRIR